jgi:ribosomal protein S18 acetylase RimI-like enzyme
MTLSVRAAAGADLPALSRIFRAASLSNDGDRAVLLAHPEVLELDLDLLVAGRTLVATGPDRRVVGFARTHESAPGVLELDDLFVDPDWMRRGAARALLRAIVAEAAIDHANRIEVTANTHALGFYQAVGFQDVGVATTEFGPAPRMALSVVP